MDQINVGLNGFGRIGKCLFLQMLEIENISIRVINTSLDLKSIENYINHDSNHGRRNYLVEIIDDKKIKIEDHEITIVNERILGDINWRELGVEYLFETSGVYLTHDDLNTHLVDYILLSSPPKDDTKMFCFGVNHDKYQGERIISTASCTTNCLCPFLNFCENYLDGIEEASFVTVHSATSSQSVSDMSRDKKRTNRSIFNNIIPHTTGASKSIGEIIPSLKNKIVGNSIRVPVSNVSMVDLNIRFYKEINKYKFFSILEEFPDEEVISVNHDNCVSSDFMTSEIPCIVDYNSVLEISPKSLKIQIWYDNEWSYSSQMLRMCDFMFEHNKNEK